MPVYNRRGLRQRLGQQWIADTLVGNTSGSWGATASLTILDTSLIDLSASGEALYARAWMRNLGSAGFIQDCRIASFNIGSGAFLMLRTSATTIFSGMPYEVHEIVPPAEKDRAIDATIRDVRIRNEVPLWAIDNGHVYSLGPEILDVLDVRVLSDPTDSLNTGMSVMPWWKVETTASGQQVRVSSALLASQQLILDAILTTSLGAGDLATVNLPSDDWILAGAAARCYWNLEQRAPGQSASAYRDRRVEARRAYTHLSARFQPTVSRPIQLAERW